MSWALQCTQLSINKQQPLTVPAQQLVGRQCCKQAWLRQNTVALQRQQCTPRAICWCCRIQQHMLGLASASAAAAACVASFAQHHTIAILILKPGTLFLYIWWQCMYGHTAISWRTSAKPARVNARSS